MLASLIFVLVGFSTSALAAMAATTVNEVVIANERQSTNLGSGVDGFHKALMVGGKGGPTVSPKSDRTSSAKVGPNGDTTPPSVEDLVTKSLERLLPTALDQQIQRSQIPRLEAAWGQMDLVLKFFPFVTVLIGLIGVVITGYGLFSAVVTRNEAKEMKESAKKDLEAMRSETNRVLERAESEIDRNRNQTSHLIQSVDEKLVSSIRLAINERIDGTIRNISYRYHQSLEKWFQDFITEQTHFQNYLHQIRSHLWSRSLSKVSDPSSGTTDAFGAHIRLLLKHEQLLAHLLSRDQSELMDGLGYFEHEFRGDSAELPQAWLRLLSLLYKTKRLTDPGNADLARAILDRHFHISSLGDIPPDL